MILRVEILMRQEQKGYYDELVKSAEHNTPDLRVQYLGL